MERSYLGHVSYNERGALYGFTYNMEMNPFAISVSWSGTQNNRMIESFLHNRRRLPDGFHGTGW